ncbi:MAG: hypothetical protein IKN64_06575 [Desulfovibrio sp.]|nr:hypothetical protein [Desulfovibrio sp.]
MWKKGCLFAFCLLAIVCSSKVWAADARHDAYLKAARAFVLEHKLPDGETIDKETIIDDFAENKLAICDVNGDGKPELLVRFTTAARGSRQEFICGFDEKTGKLTVIYTSVPEAEYFKNGCLKEPAARNKGLAGEKFWPYNMLMYNAKTGEYEEKGFVFAWSKEEFPTNDDDVPFPTGIDVTHDGFVYFIDDENFKGAKGTETPVDTPIYKAWVKHYTGGEPPIKVTWVPATADGIKALETK